MPTSARTPRTARWWCGRSGRPPRRSTSSWRDGTHSALEQVHPGGVFEGRIKGAKLPLAYQLEVDYGDSGHDHDRRPVPLPADDRRARRAPARRGPPRGAVGAPRRARARGRRRRRHRVRGLGAVGARACPSSATSTTGTGASTRCARSAPPASGSCSCPASAPGARYKYEILAPGRRDPPEGRPGRVRDRGAAQDGRRSCTTRSTSGPTRSGSRSAARAARSRARCRSTRSTSARGG